MHEDAAGDAVAVYTCKCFPAAFCILDYPPYQEDIKKYHECAAEESPFLSDRTEDEVGTLLGNEAECGLGAVEVALSEHSSRTYGYLGLVDVISDTGRVFLHAQQHLDTFPLVVLEHAVEYEVRREHEHDTSDHRDKSQLREHVHFPECEVCGNRKQKSQYNEQNMKRLYP